MMQPRVVAVEAKPTWGLAWGLFWRFMVLQLMFMAGVGLIYGIVILILLDMGYTW